jgi:SNF2 family DNA or RNA helicase
LLRQSLVKVLWGDGVRAKLQNIHDQGIRALTQLIDPMAGLPALRWPDEIKRKPMPHQLRAIHTLITMGCRAILADDMGLGKTTTSILAWQQTGIQKALVICPKTVKRNWQREIWATLHNCNVHLIDGNRRQRASCFAEAAADQTKGRKALILNYDILNYLEERQEVFLDTWVKDGLLICDESHALKSRQAKRTKYVMEHLAPKEGGAVARLLLSGTPVRNTAEDLWSQIQIVRPGTWASFHQFDSTHLERAPMVLNKGTKKEITKNPVRRLRHPEILNRIVNSMQVRRKKEEVLHLPPKIFTYPDLDLDPSTLKVYRMMKDYMLIDLRKLSDELGPETTIFHPQARSALEAMLRLEQIAQGFLGGIPEPYLEKLAPHLAKHAEKIDGRSGHLMFKTSTKVEWLMDTITSVRKQGGQPVIFSRFNSPMFWLVEKFENAAMLHGGLNDKQRNEIIDGFQDHQVKVLFCQVRCAEGFNLTAGRDVIFYGRDWSPAVNSQATDRCHRIGQLGTVNVQVPVVSGTFEAYLHKKLAAKEADAEQSLRSVTLAEIKEAI